VTVLQKPFDSVTLGSARSTFYHSDCLDVFAQLPARSVDVIVTSPPYNLGIQYNQYQDTLSRSDYLQWTNAWVAAAARVLRPEGHLITTADNRVCLSRLLDPRATPHLAPLRAALKRFIGRSGDVPLVANHASLQLDHAFRLTTRSYVPGARGLSVLSAVPSPPSIVAPHCCRISSDRTHPISCDGYHLIF
jgi:hypothetical protein